MLPKKTILLNFLMMMKKSKLFSFLVCIILWAGVCCSDTNSYIKCCFSPQDNCEQIWIDVINSATNHIHIACYGITNDKIGDALIEQAKNKIKVILCVDKLQASGRKSLTNKLKNNNIEVIIKKRSALQHNKMISVDGRDGIIGAWNLSNSAQKQDNSIVLFINQTNHVASIENAWMIIYKRDKENK